MKTTAGWEKGLIKPAELQILFDVCISLFKHVDSFFSTLKVFDATINLLDKQILHRILMDVKEYLYCHFVTWIYTNKKFKLGRLKASWFLQVIHYVIHYVPRIVFIVFIVLKKIRHTVYAIVTNRFVSEQHANWSWIFFCDKWNCKT